MDWRAKGGIQKILSYIPAGRQIHYGLQRRFGGLRNVQGECLERIDEWLLLVQRLRARGVGIEQKDVLEMGTGYYPAFPLCMYLAGARRVFTFDITRHLRADLTLICAGLLAQQSERLTAALPDSAAEVSARARRLLGRLQEGSSLEQATEGCVSYRAPGDASKTGLADASVDLVFSNNVLEHVPRESIQVCLAEASRILRPGGWIAHQIDCGDHYADTDRNINKYNYLAWGNVAWRLWDNGFLYQNRLRMSDFRELAERSGFDTTIAIVEPTADDRRQLAGTSLAAEFARCSEEDLLVTNFAVLGQVRHT